MLRRLLHQPSELLREFGSSARQRLRRRVKVLVWNVNKQKYENSQRDFCRLCRGMDIVLVQEACIRPEMRGFLHASKQQRWVLAQNLLTPARHPAGVMTGSKAAPLHSRHIKSPHAEPFTRTHKMSLATRYAVKGIGRALLVVNVHAVNFVSTDKFAHQLRALEDIISPHRGPVIMAGDFNTWNAKRQRLLYETAARLGLMEAGFAPGEKTRCLGHEVDKVFFRECSVVSARVRRDVKTSDHYPLQLRAVLE
ncbi:MAG: endonuclease/exonuclease/phosphatase family protein [Elusimicrobiales bacterium]|nr:endonuclease/exonuclease/phosphatase family protein [Elusimicrobiales bacterium]